MEPVRTIITNTLRFPVEWKSSRGRTGRSVFATQARDFIEALRQDHQAIALVNCDPGLTWSLCSALRTVPQSRLVALDLVLREPGVFWRKPLVWRKRFLLRRVNLFLNYFQDTSGLQRVYGIEPQRCCYVPFKANLPPPEFTPSPGEGDYVLCFGRSLRDFDTFFDAVQDLAIPTAIAQPDRRALAEHGARFQRSVHRLPPGLRILPDDGSQEAQIRILRGAAVVALPVLRGSLVASGISTCWNAMLYGKCVVGTEGPGAQDIFPNEILAVPPENPHALREAIQRVWTDLPLRRRLAEAGRRIALSVGGEAELHQRVIDALDTYGETASLQASANVR